MSRFNVYQGSTLIAWLDADSFAAGMRAAVAYVRAMSHADGVSGGSGYQRSPGRLSYERGIYRAVNAVRFDGK